MNGLVLKDLNKTYYKNQVPIQAVKTLNLTFEENQFVALLGPSGCGKSTTLRMIAGLEDITSGEILIKDKLVNDTSPKDRNIGLGFENYALYPPLSVYENIAFNLKAKKFSKSKIKNEIHRISELLGIKDLLEMKPSNLSGGQKQRVNIARAIIRRPEVLLLDEPLSHLDARVRKKMRTEIKHLHTEINSVTVIVTHDQAEAMALADKIAIINHGELQQFGTPLEVFNKPTNEFVAGFIGEPPMNLFDVVTEKDSGQFYFRTTSSSLRFKVPEQYQDTVVEGESYRFGIRPTDIRVASGNDPYTIHKKVTAYENLGEECRIHIDIEDENLLNVTSDQILQFSPGDDIKLFFIPEKIHLFNMDHGERITSAMHKVEPSGV